MSARARCAINFSAFAHVSLVWTRISQCHSRRPPLTTGDGRHMLGTSRPVHLSKGAANTCGSLRDLDHRRSDNATFRCGQTGNSIFSCCRRVCTLRPENTHCSSTKHYRHLLVSKIAFDSHCKFAGWAGRSPAEELMCQRTHSPSYCHPTPHCSDSDGIPGGALGTQYFKAVLGS